MYELFRTMSRISREGISILLVEQNANQTLRLAQRAYVLEMGRITCKGKAEALRTDPEIRSAYLGL